MKWQDYVISSGLFVFTIALVPSIRGKDKPALFTSIMTSSVMYVFTMTFITLGLWASALGQFVGASAWATLAIQKYLQVRSKDTDTNPVAAPSLSKS